MTIFFGLLAIYAVSVLIFRSLLITELLNLITHLRLRSRYKPRTADLYAQPMSVVAHEDIPHLDHFLTSQLRDFSATHANRLPCKPVVNAITFATRELYEQELTARPIVPSQNYLIAEGAYRDQVLASLNKRKNLALNFRRFEQSLLSVWDRYQRYLPDGAFDRSEEPFAQIALIDSLPAAGGAMVNDLTNPILNTDTVKLGLFTEFTSRYDRNVFAASGAEYPNAVRKLILPAEFKGSTPQLVNAYLKDTPLYGLFKIDVPFSFVEKLGEHGVMVAPSGTGKTQLLQALALHLLKQPDPPTIIILNSQGKMLDKIQKLAIFAPGQPLSERLVVIDPQDDNPPALNMFAVPTERLKKYTRNERDQIEAGTLQTFDYLFSSLNTSLTGKQSTIFYPLVKLMLSIPGATFNTLIEILKESPSVPKGTPDQEIWRRSAWAEDFMRLEPHDREFFQSEYFSRHYTNTRQEITQRIRRFIENRAFRRMFAASDNKLDLFTLINRGSVILVNTSKALLQKDGSAFFGRWFVSLLIRAAYERVVLDNPRRTYLLIDEASDYIDQSFEEILSKLRQFNVGCFMAFQNAGQIPIMGSVLANTSVKLFAGDQPNDAAAFAKSMRSTPEFLMSTVQYTTLTQFATFVRGLPTAVRMSVPLGVLEAAPQMTNDQHSALIARNRKRYSSDDEAPPDAPIMEPADEPPPRPPQLHDRYWKVKKAPNDDPANDHEY